MLDGKMRNKYPWKTNTLVPFYGGAEAWAYAGFRGRELLFSIILS